MEAFKVNELTNYNSDVTPVENNHDYQLSPQSTDEILEPAAPLKDHSEEIY